MKSSPLIALLAASAASWVSAYDAPDGGFRIEFPAPPIVAPYGVDGTSYKVVDGDVTYIVRRLTCDKDCQSGEQEAFYEDFEQGAVSKVSATLLSHRRVDAGAHRGHEFVLETKKRGSEAPHELVTRVFRVGHGLYAVVAAGPRETSARARAAKVLDSFVPLK